MHRRVYDRALVEVRGCLRDWDDGRDAAREAKAVAETIIAPEYEGRGSSSCRRTRTTHPAGAADGRNEIRLDEGEGEHGTLYVANRGKPFGGRNCKDLCGVALSSERADAGIGHRGVGYKSVLHLCDAPRSTAWPGRDAGSPTGLPSGSPLDDYDALAREVAPERASFAAYL
ncbi:hypothetical protein [Streptomyces hebeiensis]|uniref:hypothetical protein n=1 Tax=Streptomyces hebeiensis TaxID=229486 RepID=UPI0031D1808B